MSNKILNTKRAGSNAEDAAAQYLVRHGFDIVERNFKTPRCEIDIIAKRKGCLYFVEVKYRSQDGQGGGLDYVTSAKRRQMQRAAEIWLQMHAWKNEVTLSAVEVAANYEVAEFIESIV